MNVDLEPRGVVSVALISGSVDGLSAETLLARLHEYVAEGHVRLVADFTAVDYTSSAGLRALLATVKETRRHGGDLRLAGVAPNVLKVLELSGFTTILKLYADVDAAIDSFA